VTLAHQPDEEIYVVDRHPHWTSWFVPSFSVACVAAAYVANAIWGASAVHSQVEGLSDLVSTHTKQLSEQADKISRLEMTSAVTLERVTSVQRTVDRIDENVRMQTDQQQAARRKASGY
jgi:hypothetical protein